MKIAYARVSSQGQNLDMQIDAFQKAGCEKIFTESRSAFKTRPELERVFDLLRPGDEFYIWSLDRLGRTMFQLLNNIKILNEKGVILRVTTVNIDTSTPTGKILIWAFGMLAELENDLRKERQREGLLSAKSRGKPSGRRPGMSESSKEKIPLIKSLYLSTDPLYSIRDISKIAKVSFATLYKCLEYAGIRKGKKHSDSK